jgi:hypothetical protein
LLALAYLGANEEFGSISRIIESGTRLFIFFAIYSLYMAIIFILVAIGTITKEQAIKLDPLSSITLLFFRKKLSPTSPVDTDRLKKLGGWVTAQAVMREKNMNETKKRKLAAFISLMVASGNLGVIAITINVGTFNDFVAILPTSPQLIFVVLTGIISLVIGTALLTTIKLGKKSLLTALIISVIIFTIAAVQISMVLLLVLFWPWSLYRLYRSETA